MGRRSLRLVIVMAVAMGSLSLTAVVQAKPQKGPSAPETQEPEAPAVPQPPSSTPAPRADGFGLTAGCCTPAGVSFVSQAEGYAATGAGWVRMGFDWRSLEPTEGSFNWHRDAAVATFAGTGMKVLGVLAYTPAWAADPACDAVYGNKCAPTDPAAFARFAAATVERYDGDGITDAPGSPRVDAWEVWNEPNIAQFWRPTPSPAAYTTLLTSAYPAMKAADASTTVVSAGLSPAGGTLAPLEFLRGMYTSGAGGSFDALGFHPYSYPHLPSKRAIWNAWQQMSETFPNVGQVDSLRTLMVANGDGAKKIWATEFGAPTSGDTNGDGQSVCDNDGIILATEDRCITQERQAQMVSEAYQLWQSYDWAGPLFWYSYQDLASGTASIENNFGLLRSDGTPKPALAAYRSAVAAALPDVTAPSAPSNVRAVVVGTSVTLSWTPSSDDRGVAGYRVYRDGVLRGTSLLPTLVDAGQRRTSYTYTVAAYDQVGNVSPASAPVSVRTGR